MKKMFNLKKMMLVFVCLLFFGGPVFAQPASIELLTKYKPELGTMKTVETHTKERTLSNGLIQKEVVTIIKHVYDKAFAEIPHKYTTVEIENSFLKAGDRSVLAISKLEANFRHTQSMNLAECLSVSRGNVSNAKNYSFDTIVRRSNKTQELGCASAKIEFKNIGITVQKNVYEINCDPDGNITY